MNFYCKNIKKYLSYEYTIEEIQQNIIQKEASLQGGQDSTHGDCKHSAKEF